MDGKQKCRILKQIRQQIALSNDIDLVIEECKHKGRCLGTCPRCEAEVRYLERELEKRRRTQKRVALAGISAGLTMALTGCAPVTTLIDSIHDAIVTPAPTAVDMPMGTAQPIPDTTGMPTPTPEPHDLMGDVAIVPTPTDEPDVEVLDGEVALIDLIDDETERDARD